MMQTAVDDLIKTGVTREPLLVNIMKAERINRRHGGILVKPWELARMPEDTLLMYEAMFGAEERKQAHEKKEAMFRAFRQKHKYRNYL